MIFFHLKRKDFLEGESDSERNPEVLTNIAPQHSQVAIGSVEAWHLGWSFDKRVAEPSEGDFVLFLREGWLTSLYSSSHLYNRTAWKGHLSP